MFVVELASFYPDSWVATLVVLDFEHVG